MGLADRITSQVPPAVARLNRDCEAIAAEILAAIEHTAEGEDQEVTAWLSEAHKEGEVIIAAVTRAAAKLVERASAL